MGQQILGRKQKISNDAWLKAMEQIEDLVSKQELDEKVRQTVKDIKATTGGKKAAVAWSGGKTLWCLQMSADRQESRTVSSW